MGWARALCKCKQDVKESLDCIVKKAPCTRKNVDFCVRAFRPG